ncbi:MAG: hypothetical protein QXV83_00740 [Candidatus Anstonellaceae archaeon]
MQIDISKTFLLYKDSLLKLPELVKELKQKEFTWIDVLVNIFIFVLGVALLFALFPKFSLEKILEALIGIIPNLIITFILIILITGVIKIIAGFLGGKKDFKFVNLSYMFSLFFCALGLLYYLVLYIIGLAATFLPFLAFVGAIVLAALLIFNLVHITRIIKHVFELSTLKAVVVWLIPTLIILAIFALIVANLFFAALTYLFLNPGK